jgi:hypothetical protein
MAETVYRLGERRSPARVEPGPYGARHVLLA